MDCFFPLFRRKKVLKHASAPPNFGDDEDLQDVKNVKIYSYMELRRATNNFSPCNKAGEGGFGIVYKGFLKNGTAIAVKALSMDSRQGRREFLNEIKVVSGIKHENLVELFGCCVEQEHRMLVYEYLEKNSLAQALLGLRKSDIHINWRTRVKICLGVARGLAFLHEEVKPHIVHRDIKASNILLDEDLNPKISDFGLAKLLPPNASHISTRVAGTLGYLAPEYAIRGQVTRKSDVYSFGVLLMEVVSGRCNTNLSLRYEDQLLLEKTWDCYEKGELAKIIDPALDGDLDADEACRFLKIGLLCTQEVTKLRPAMPVVIGMLKGEADVDDSMISKPAVISDYMDVKIRSQRNGNQMLMLAMSPSTAEQSSEDPSSMEETSHASMTFTSFHDRP